MTTSAKHPTAVFPARDALIPAEARLDYYGGGARYLIDGEVHLWEGPCQTVLSPVCVRGPDGLSQRAIGEVPLMTEADALRALAAARRAYDHGRGPWPATTGS